MKKKIIYILIILFICTIAFSQENNNKGLYDFLSKNIGNQISINIIYVDTIIIGKLLNVYEDGVIIETKYNKIFITIQSIIYAKIKIDPQDK